MIDGRSLLALLVSLSSALAGAQSFPAKPLRARRKLAGEFGAVVKSQMTRLGKIIREAGIRDE
jgi:hypothetical protein